jgi:hypothetical protein
MAAGAHLDLLATLGRIARGLRGSVRGEAQGTAGKGQRSKRRRSNHGYP